MILDPESISPGAMYRFMIGVVVPRPIAFVSTVGADGRLNVAPFSYFNAITNRPPLIGISINLRGGEPKDTLRNIRATGDFVVPIMYRHGLNVTAAWGRFLTLLREHLWSFIGYGVIVFMLWVAVTGLVLFAGLSTCCVGFVLLMLPYVGQVVLLPVLAGFRALGPEFLAQFGPEYDAFALAPAAVAPAPAPGPTAPPAGAPS